MYHTVTTSLLDSISDSLPCTLKQMLFISRGSLHTTGNVGPGGSHFYPLPFLPVSICNIPTISTGLTSFTMSIACLVDV